MLPQELIICKNIYNQLVASQYPSSPHREKWQYLAPKETTQNSVYRSYFKHPSEYVCFFWYMYPYYVPNGILLNLLTIIIISGLRNYIEQV